MEKDVQWTSEVISKEVELEKKHEGLKAHKLKLGILKRDTLEEEKYAESVHRDVADIKAVECRRRTPSDLCREIVDLRGIENLIELHRRRKVRRKKAGSSARTVAEMLVMGSVNPSDFLKAAAQGWTEVIEKFLEDGGNPDTCDEFRRTALHRASLEGHMAIVQKLLDKGADINFADRLDCTAVHWACRGGWLDILKVLQSSGADLNVKDKVLSTPLHVATRTGHCDVVKYLLSSGIKVNAKDREGDTALHDAVRLNHHKIVKLLVLGGADMKAKNSDGVTAMELVKQWQFDIKETLETLVHAKGMGLL
ncbi:hypothetical protein JZ751_019815 [Albula glossodonta]|uniref:Ankyrin repeat domain-containing protein 2 n=1 Tax=Albula glossodonta TaxID=121402 RepID=A0A8T2NPP9_9TELE|nr:hypothetical protein JZ751_019815 [Albula glossodonta]